MLSLAGTQGTQGKPFLNLEFLVRRSWSIGVSEDGWILDSLCDLVLDLPIAPDPFPLDRIYRIDRIWKISAKVHECTRSTGGVYVH